VKLSVLIAAGYARPWRMRALLLALDKQTRKPDEIIICDDTKLDPSPFCDLGVGIVRTMLPAGVNGVSVARNLGIKAATGDVVLLLDDDSLPTRYCMQVHAEIHEQHPDTPLALLGQRTGEYRCMSLHPPYGPLSDKAEREYKGPLSWANFISNNLSLRRDLLLQVGGFDERFAQPGEYGWEDIELGIRWFAAGGKMGYTTDAVVYHPESKRTPAKQAAAERAYLRLVALHPEKFVRGMG
jgi:GT2 family glycosyltransferase